jgi:hypothetical protein
MLYRQGGVENASFPKIRLLRFLHLYNKVFALLVGAENIENGFSVTLDVSELFGRKILNIRNQAFFPNNSIEEVNQQLFTGLFPE